MTGPDNNGEMMMIKAFEGTETGLKPNGNPRVLQRDLIC